MNVYKLRYWTGPTQVEEWADRLVASGVKVTVRGTEHVYVEAQGSSENAAEHNVAADYEKHYKLPYPLRAR
jgi:hypothetical protein